MNTDTEILACCDCKYSEIREVPGMGKLTCCTHKPHKSAWIGVATCPIGHDKRKLALEEQSAAK